MAAVVEAASLDRWTQMELRQSGTVAQPTPTSPTSHLHLHTLSWRGLVVREGQCFPYYVWNVKKVNSEVHKSISKAFCYKVAKTG